MTRFLNALFAVSLFGIAACGGKVDPDAAQATAGCETATDALLGENETMLPGRACLNCHTKDGQAGGANLRWTVAGTVFGSTTAACNSGGLSGVKVEILRQDGSVQVTMTTNSVGNFYTLQPVTFPLRARISQGIKMQEMTELQSTGNCASCHMQPPANAAPGRLYLN